MTRDNSDKKLEFRGGALIKMPAKSSPGSKENLCSSQLRHPKTVLASLKTRFIRKDQERELCGSHTVHAGISPDYNHLFCLYSACMITLKTV